MEKKTSNILTVVLLVSVLAFILKFFYIWGITEKPVAWWGAFLLIPIYTTGTGFFTCWKKEKKKRALYLLQGCLFCIAVMVATFYPFLWQYSYIFFVLILALIFFLMARCKEK